MGTSSLEAGTEAVRQAYAALNRNDISAMVNGFDPEIEWIEPAAFPGGGTHRGLAVVKAHLSRARESWAEGTCEPERFIVAADKIVVFDQVHVRLKQETEWREGSLASVYTFRNGKVLQVRVFAERRQALEWAGAEGAGAI
jgi:uncharacterized protein